MKNKKIGNIINISFILLVLIGLITYIVTVDGVDNIDKVLRSVNYSWLVVGIVLTVIYWLLEGICFYLITKKIYKNQRFISSFRLAMIGRLFNNITPFSCGDQPAQLVAMKQEGKSLSDGASILLTRFIVYQSVFVVYTLVVIILKYSYFKIIIDKFMYLAIIGFAINMLVVIFLAALVINEKLVYNIVKYVIELLGKFKIIKDVEGNLEKFKEIIADFHAQIELIKKEKLMIIKMAIYTAIEITVLYSITYVVYRAFGLNTVDFITILAAQTFLSLVTGYMPTPGAGVAAEGGFYIVFKTFFPANSLNLSILFWRMYTFYLPIIVGMIFLVFKPKIKNEDILEQETTVEV
ncbi:MAG: hypothetical protein K0R72_382 [Clostridia bacterium]|jgi:uncharacterized protein (TIRG00374 family)|nr:hypothetical protein [Clostridia bacterium]